jgi:methyl-accepting chemotaxis protein
MSISGKLISGSIANIVLLLALTVLGWWSINHLRDMQDIGSKRDEHALRTTEASALGAEMYQVIADLVINRDFDATAKRWAEERKIAEAEFADIESFADTPEEKALLAESRAAYEQMVRLFEGEMLPALQSAAEVDAGLRAIDAKIGAAAQKLTTSLREERRAMDEEAAAANEAFHDIGRLSSLMMLIIAGIAIVLALGIAIGSARGIAVPVRAMTRVMKQLSAGDTSVVVIGQNRRDEIGEMAQSVNVFKDSMIESERLRAEQERLKEQAARERRGAVMKMADDFEGAVGSVIRIVSSAATELQSAAESMTATADRTAQQSNIVAAASDEASTNVQTVAAATEELSSSVQEISRQVAQSSAMTTEAVNDAEETNARVEKLAEAAQKIGDVVRLISDIAGQTNLLALNATIEAARAGEAGRGFAVVASEVKNLAGQTAKATEEITEQVAGIQSATDGSVRAIAGIGETIRAISNITSGIAAAVEEQSAATVEISRNIQQAAIGTGEVSSNIGAVNQAAVETGDAATQVLDAARDLSKQAEALSVEVGRFLDTIRAA